MPLTAPVLEFDLRELLFTPVRGKPVEPHLLQVLVLPCTARPFDKLRANGDEVNRSSPYMFKGISSRDDNGNLVLPDDKAVANDNGNR